MDTSLASGLPPRFLRERCCSLLVIAWLIVFGCGCTAGVEVRQVERVGIDVLDSRSDRAREPQSVVRSMEEWLRSDPFPVHIAQIGNDRLLVIRRYQDSRFSVRPLTMVKF